jgi:hypothetical protein
VSRKRKTQGCRTQWPGEIMMSHKFLVAFSTQRHRGLERVDITIENLEIRVSGVTMDSNTVSTQFDNRIMINPYL